VNFKKHVVFFGFIILIMVSTFLAFGQEPDAVPTDVTVSAGQQDAIKNTNDAQWAWGEVTNVDAQAKTFTLKYLDYETDQEKDLVLIIDENTVFENIKSFDEIKVKDTLSIDYMITAEGKNLAKNINFEQPDATPATSVPSTQEAKSEVLAPAIEEPVLPAEITIVPAPASVEVAPVIPTPSPAIETDSAPVEAAPAVETVPVADAPVDQVQ
jgi:hypothetical protein